jgi:tripartite-type tricarboxylate transporter receptor subunit TctC
VVHPSLDVSDVPQLISLLRSRTEGESYASAGNGTPAHLAAVLFGSMAGVKLNHVPYKGAAPGLQAVLGGEVKMMFSEASVASSHIASGRVRPLAVTGIGRSALLPDLITLDEAGLAGYETRSGRH